MEKIGEKLSSRVKTLRETYLEVKPSIAINRALAYTEVYKKYSDMPKNILRSKGFKRACETAPLSIQKNELIVGHPCGKARAGSFSPDIAWEWMEAELDTIGIRDQDPYIISEDDKRTMREEIFPYWKGRSLAEACEKRLKEEEIWEFGAEACISDLTYHMTSGGGDTSPGFDTILLKKGIAGIKSDAQRRLQNLLQEKSQDKKKEEFFRAVMETCEGVVSYAERLSAYALELAEDETNPERKSELRRIAQINSRVPANPPETFYEALQSLWTAQSLFLMEENQCSTSLGRLDQYLYPYYEKDIQSGRLTREEAFDLIACFMIKCSEVIWYTPGATARYFAGYMPFINMSVGGVKRDGSDGTNDLTYLIMDVVKNLRIYQPTLACRIHGQSPQRYLEEIVEIIGAGGGMPACHFDDVHIKMMMRKGFDIEDARDYCIMGCVEPQKSGEMHQWTAGGFTQWPILLELLFNRGVLKSYGTRKWMDTGDLRRFTTYEEFSEGIKRQLDYLLEMNCRGTNLIQEVFRDINPTPYMSLFVEGCMDSGRDVTDGGAALYAGPGTIFAGLGTFVDSMAAIKKLVYEEGKYTLIDLKEAMDADWKGYEDVRRDCLEAPKYGNDDDYADLIAREIIEYTEKSINRYPSLYATQIHGTLSQSFNTPLGEMIGATPDGRLAYTFLSDGMSPSQGADRRGITAVVKSASKINPESMSLGMAHNFKLTPNLLKTKEGKMGIVSILRGASSLGNGQMQFNCVDNKELIKAQKNPENYRDLIVRVAGYSAFFVELCKDVQEEIIARTTLDSESFI